ncbi:hypothetical protein QZH41_007216, partial [Actinostola sp. cb2023]
MTNLTTIPSAVLGGVITIENLMVCFLVYRFRYLKTWTNGFIASLAVSDILFGVIVVPLHIVDEMSPATGYLIAMVLLVNIANLLSTTFDRYLAVLKPFLYTTFMEKAFCRIVVSAWIAPIVISMLPLLWSADPMTTIHTVYLLCVLLLGILIPYVLIIIAYTRIFREVIKQVKRVVKLCVAKDRHSKRRDAAIKEAISKKVGASFVASCMFAYQARNSWRTCRLAPSLVRFSPREVRYLGFLCLLGLPVVEGPSSILLPFASSSLEAVSYPQWELLTQCDPQKVILKFPRQDMDMLEAFINQAGGEIKKIKRGRNRRKPAPRPTATATINSDMDGITLGADHDERPN